LLGNAYITLRGDPRYSSVVMNNPNLASTLSSEAPITVFLPYVPDGGSLSSTEVGTWSIIRNLLLVYNHHNSFRIYKYEQAEHR